MRFTTARALLTATLLAIGLSACGVESPASPDQRAITPASGASASILLGSPTAVTPLLRTTPLAAPISVSRTVGILGGAISIPQAGLTVVVPALAVTSPTTITVTALAGSQVAYEFAPHGIRFTTPLVMTQNLLGTQARSGGSINPLSLFVGYFPNSTTTTSVTELLSVNLSVLNTLATTTLWHFSGYIYASGRESEE
jgi:hypothetical protein